MYNKWKIIMAIFAAVLVTLVIVTSCKRAFHPKISPAVVSTNELETIPFTQLISFVQQQIGENDIRYVTGNTAYSLPDEEWLGSAFSKGFKTFVWDLQQQNYYPESNDCDKFSLLCEAYANILHYHTTNVKSGLAFGIFWYFKGGTGEPHAVNMAVVRDKNKNLKLIFFEPQAYQIVTLNKNEIESCYFWMFA